MWNSRWRSTASVATTPPAGRMRERDRPGFVRHYCGADVVSVELTGAMGACG